LALSRSTSTIRYDLEANGLAISARRCSTLHGRSNWLPSMRDPATRVSEGCVFSMLLRRLGVTFHEFTKRKVVLLNYFVKISYRSHLEIISIVSTSSFFPV
jgi:hypothetical protein